MRAFFRRLNRFMLWIWRFGGGTWVNAWPAVGGRIMVITHTGRRSRLRRRTPVNYAQSEDGVFCISGFGARGDWYLNLRADPRVEVELPREHWAGVAQDVSDAPDRTVRLRQVLIASGFAAYAAGINPRRITQAELERLADQYRLIRIRRTGS